MKCILHIGLPKTASTYLQQQVFSRISEQCSRLIYDKAAFDKLFKHVEECFVHEDKPLGPHVENLREHLLGLKESNPDGVLLVSREQIASLHHIRYESYREVVRGVFSEVDTRVLIVARYQPDWLWSLYKHTAGKPIGYTPRRFFRMEGKGERTRFSYHTGADPMERDFWALHEYYARHFGEVELKFFEHFAEDERTFVDGIFDGYGLRYEHDWPRRRLNTNVPEDALGFFLALCLPPTGFELEAHGGETLPRIRNGIRRVGDGFVRGWNRSLLRLSRRLPKGLTGSFAPENPFYRNELKSRFDRRNREMSATLGITPPAKYTDGNHLTDNHANRPNESVTRTA